MWHKVYFKYFYSLWQWSRAEAMNRLTKDYKNKTQRISNKKLAVLLNQKEVKSDTSSLEVNISWFLYSSVTINWISLGCGVNQDIWGLWEKLMNVFHRFLLLLALKGEHQQATVSRQAQDSTEMCFSGDVNTATRWWSAKAAPAKWKQELWFYSQTSQ